MPRDPEPCPLCAAPAPFSLTAWGRPLHRCPGCGLVFVPRPFHPPLADEKARYALHRNHIGDEGYVRFLMPVVDALRHRAVRGPVLDFGSGPAPVLVELLRRAGFAAEGYDPFFGPAAPARAEGRFAAIVSTEVFEHFRNPAGELDRIARWLRPGGMLVAMTTLLAPDTDLAAWPYANDPTHLAFYSERTFEWIAHEWGLIPRGSSARNLVVLERGEAPSPRPGAMAAAGGTH
jgi:SAM-dependent methyltransferase